MAYAMVTQDPRLGRRMLRKTQEGAGPLCNLPSGALQAATLSRRASNEVMEHYMWSCMALDAGCDEASERGGGGGTVLSTPPAAAHVHAQSPVHSACREAGTFSNTNSPEFKAVLERLDDTAETVTRVGGRCLVFRQAAPPLPIVAHVGGALKVVGWYPVPGSEPHRVG